MKDFPVAACAARLRYLELGEGSETVVVLHGLGCASSFDYPGVVSRNVLRDYRFLLVDLLGSGYSDKPESFGYSLPDHAAYLEDFLRSLDRKVHLFGHSMGGALAVETAARCPELVSSLVSAEGNLDPGGGAYSRKIAAKEEAAYIAGGHAAMTADYASIPGNKWAPALAATLPKAIWSEARSLVDGTSPTWREKLYSFRFPRTYILGRRTLPSPHLETLPSRGVRVSILEDAGHSMAWDNPEGLAALLAEALDWARG